MQDLQELERALALRREGERLRRDHIEAARMRQERLRVASEMAVLQEAVSAVEVLREMLRSQKPMPPELLSRRRAEPTTARFELVMRLERGDDKPDHDE